MESGELEEEGLEEDASSGGSEEVDPPLRPGIHFLMLGMWTGGFLGESRLRVLTGRGCLLA